MRGEPHAGCGRGRGKRPVATPAPRPRAYLTTGLREAKAPLHGAGPGTGAMLRSGSPALIAQEIAAWAAATEMTRGVTRDAALAAAPAEKGRRAGQPVRYRDLSLTRARRLILAAIRSGKTSYKALTSQIARFRAVTDRNRHRARKSKSPSAFDHASREGHGHPHRPGRHHHGQQARLTSGNSRKPGEKTPARPWIWPPRHDTPTPGMPTGRKLPAVVKNRELRTTGQTSKAHGIASGVGRIGELRDLKGPEYPSDNHQRQPRTPAHTNGQ